MLCLLNFLRWRDPGMAMGMDMDMPCVRRVVMHMKVIFLSQQSTQHVHAERDQHQRDRQLKRLLHPGGNRLAQRQHNAAKQHQGERVADAPCHALANRLSERKTP